MEQSGFAKWLKIITIGIGMLGLLFYFVLLPDYGTGLVESYPEFSGFYWPWLLFAWVTSVPCYLCLLEYWKICYEIGIDNSFSEKNARSLKKISQFLILDSAIVFVGNVILFAMEMNHPGVALLMFFVVIAGVAVSVVAAALSHLVLKASVLEEDNSLTI